MVWRSTPSLLILTSLCFLSLYYYICVTQAYAWCNMTLTFAGWLELCLTPGNGGKGAGRRSGRMGGAGWGAGPRWGIKGGSGPGERCASGLPWGHVPAAGPASSPARAGVLPRVRAGGCRPQEEGSDGAIGGTGHKSYLITGLFISELSGGFWTCVTQNEVTWVNRDI